MSTNPLLPLVFLCASSLESTRLLMLSRAPKSPDGLGSNSGVLGSYLMDHLVLSAEGIGPTLGVQSPSEESRGLFLSRFDARNFAAPKPARGFGVQLYQFPGPGDQSHFVAASFSEMLPRQQNRVMLDPLVKDAWGIPALRIECAHSDAEFARVREQSVALSELIKLFAVRSIRVDEAPAAPGSANHECGTARMGTDPINSVLDPNNQCWEAKGLYVTDGASFPSQGHQNPTLTILALTARACHHALRNIHG